jgi:hypothetical protein
VIALPFDNDIFISFKASVALFSRRQGRYQKAVEMRINNICSYLSWNLEGMFSG